MALRDLLEQLRLSKAEQAFVLVLVAALLAAVGLGIRRDAANRADHPTVLRGPRAACLAIDLNTAPAHELMLLPSIGEKRAQDIIRYRESRPGGRFTRLEELAAIKGLSLKGLDRLRPFVTLSKPEDAK